MKHYEGDEFPIHIDLGKEQSDMAVPMESTKDGEKKKKYYPSLYLSDIKGLDGLPKDGCALIEFHRRNVSIGDNGESADLEIRAICLMEPESDGEDLKDSFAKFAASKGVDSGASDEEETDEED